MDIPLPLIVMALEIESQGLFARAGVAVSFTGIGKVNAAYSLTRLLAEYRLAQRPLPQVINFGTVGSRRFASHTTVACNAFVQCDMDVSGLGFARGVTPFEETPPRLEFPVRFPELPAGVCGTADSFVTGATGLPCDVVDMEAYALAKVCWREGASFACVKYVTDGADHAAGNDWQANLAAAAEKFLSVYQQWARPLPPPRSGGG